MGLATIIKKGTTSCILEIAIRSSTSGQLLTGLTEADMTIEYQRQGAALHVSVTPVAGTLGTWASGSWVENIPGVYQFGVPDAALAAGADFVVVVFTSAGSLDADTMIYLTASDLQDAVDLGLGNLDVSVSSRSTFGISSLTQTLPTVSAPAGLGYVQCYCTVADVVAALKIPGGNTAGILGHIRAASDHLRKEIGPFIPSVRALRLDGSGRKMQPIPPVLSILSLSVDGQTVVQDTDYFACPLNRHWEDGPYSWLEINPDISGVLGRVWYRERGCIDLVAYAGYYQKWTPTGTSLASEQTIGDAVAVVGDGSKLSPGMHLVFDAEQQLVTDYGTPSAAITTLGTTCTPTDTILALASGAAVLKGELIRIGFEQMMVLDDPQVNSVLVGRGWNGTQAAAHLANAAVDIYRTYAVERGINGTTAALHASATAISRYMVPDDIFFLVKEIASLMKKKEDSSFAGKTGNAALGETFYNDIFPRFDIEPVRKHYKITVVH
jgi:hypothetical protein